MARYTTRPGPASVAKGAQTRSAAAPTPAGTQPLQVRSRPNGGLEVSLTDGVNVLALVVAPRGVRAAPGIASRRVDGGFVWLVGNLPQGALDAALAGVRRLDTAGLGTFLKVDASNP